MHHNWLIGILSLDFLYYINNALLILVYLGLFASMRKTDFANLLIAITIGFIGIGIYYVSSVAFEMLSVSRQFFTTESMEAKQQLPGIAKGLIVTYKGTAFDVYYVFNAITLLIISKTMLKSGIFSKGTVIWGIIAGLLMIIPSTAGTLGLVFSLVSLLPWIIFSVMAGKRLLVLSAKTV
ncbi:hypothetical protein ACE1ET_04610 [Saccharicrinis sp. FJH62]|uniref:hypothetical protein n=1 Tax=Saccharicrinis sp. FJH62 TaxID=3344657 RepID=UPI0035D475AD